MRGNTCTPPSTDYILEASMRALTRRRADNGHLSRLSFLELLLKEMDENYAAFARAEYLRGLEEGYASGRESQT